MLVHGSLCSKLREENKLLCRVNLSVRVALYQTAKLSWEQAVRGGQVDDTQLTGLLPVSFGEWEASFSEAPSSDAGSP